MKQKLKDFINTIIDFIVKIIKDARTLEIIEFIKKLKSSKTYYTMLFVFVLPTLFTQAFAWKDHEAILAYIDTYSQKYPCDFCWDFVRIFFEEEGSIVLVGLATFVLILLSIVKINEDNTKKEVSDINVGGNNIGTMINGAYNHVTQTIVYNINYGDRITLLTLIIFLPLSTFLFFQNNYVGITEKTRIEKLQPIKNKIKELELKCQKNYTQECDLQLLTAKNEIDELDENLNQLDEMIKVYPLEAKQTIYNLLNQKYGIQKVLIYLDNIKFKKHESYIDKQNIEIAQRAKIKAYLYRIEKQYDEAKNEYTKMIKYDSRYEALFEYAKYLQNQNYTKEAINLYERILLDNKLTPKQQAKNTNNIAMEYKKLQRYPEAEKFYKESLDIKQRLAKEEQYKPFLLSTLNNLGTLYQEQNKTDKAQKNFKEVDERYKKLSNKTQESKEALGDAFFNLATINSNKDVAINDYKKSLDIYEKLLLQENKINVNDSKSITRLSSEVTKQEYKNKINIIKSQINLLENKRKYEQLFLENNLKNIKELIATYQKLGMKREDIEKRLMHLQIQKSR